MKHGVTFQTPFRKGKLIRRVNRFLALVEVDGVTEEAHVPNSGRMAELMVPGLRVFLTEHATGTRKTRFTLSLVDTGLALVSIDSRLPNLIFIEGFKGGRLSRFKGYDRIRGEVTVEDSRFDYLLSNEDSECYTEVKSVTLVKDGKALFPDAPTERGTKHLRGLIRLREAGHRAAMVFIVQRDDAGTFSPNEEADPDFTAALREAKRRGVDLLAFSCRVDLRGIRIQRRIRVIL